MERISNSKSGKSLINPQSSNIQPSNTEIINGYIENDDYQGQDLDKDQLLKENLLWAMEDALQQYKSRKKNIFVAYLIFYFTFFIFANFYVGRKRLAMAQLVSLIIAIALILIALLIETPQGFNHALENLIIFVFSCYWLFDLFTLWSAVKKYNSNLYQSIFNNLYKRPTAGTAVVSTTSSRSVTTATRSGMPSTFHRRSNRIQRQPTVIRKSTAR